MLLIILLASVTQANAQGSLADNLFTRVLTASSVEQSFQNADLDQSTLRKAGHHVVRRGTTSASSWAAYRPQIRAISYPEVSSRGFAAGPASVGAGSRMAGMALARQSDVDVGEAPSSTFSRRDALVNAMGVVGGAATLQQAGPAEASGVADALKTRLKAAEAGRARLQKKANIPLSAYTEIPNTKPPILYYDLVKTPSQEAGNAETPEAVKDGQRIAIHYDLKWRGITIGTSRQGMGVTGGSPYGFDVGVPAGKPGGPFIKAFNYGVKGMEIGQLRRMVVPPEYAYGNLQVQEIPPDSTVTLDIELLSIKTGAFY